MKKERMPSYGGQALIEGIVMRGTKSVAAAFRTPEGKIEIHKESLGGIYQSPIKKIPFLRGLILLWDALGLGTRYLTMSANVQTGEDEKIEGASLFLTLGFSLLIAVVFFFLLPAALGQLVEKAWGWNAWVSNLVEGLFRLVLLIAYIYFIGKMDEIERVFAYHGAEHKTINAFEDHAELTPEIVAKYSVEHPRCGTGFLLTVVLFSILIFTALGPLSIFWRLFSRVLLIPVIAGISYEYMSWTAKHLDSPFVRFLVKPNLALQHLTTREPDLDMLEISIEAFNTMYQLEQGEEVVKEFTEAVSQSTVNELVEIQQS